MSKIKRVRFLWVIIKRTHAERLVYSLLVSVFVSALILCLVEPDINRYGDALWYTFVSIFTIGFGDFAAVTVIGRIVTIAVTLQALLVLAIIPGIVTSYYIDVVKENRKESVTLFMDKLERLPDLSREELEEISERVRTMTK